VAKPNYAFAKRQRDLIKQQKKEEKRRRKLADRQKGDPEGSPQTISSQTTAPDAAASNNGSDGQDL
jgi:hypothetical protein